MSELLLQGVSWLLSLCTAVLWNPIGYSEPLHGVLTRLVSCMALQWKGNQT